MSGSVSAYLRLTLRHMLRRGSALVGLDSNTYDIGIERVLFNEGTLESNSGLIFPFDHFRTFFEFSNFASLTCRHNTLGVYRSVRSLLAWLPQLTPVEFCGVATVLSHNFRAHKFCGEPLGRSLKTTRTLGGHTRQVEQLAVM